MKVRAKLYNCAITIIIIFLLTNGIVFQQVKMPNFISYWDEALFLALLAYCLFNAIKNHHFAKKIIIPCIILFSIINIGIISNLVYDYANSSNSIIRDIVGFSKFPLLLLALYNIKREKFNYSTHALKNLLEILTGVILFFGFLSIFLDLGMSQPELRFGIHPYRFLFSHPSELVLYCVLTITLLDVIEKNKKMRLAFEMALIIIILLALRTKGFVFIVIFIAFKALPAIPPRHIKKILFILPLLILAVSSYKIIEYASYDDTPRGSLYSGAVTLAKDNFPLGSGFATFASDLSVRSESKVYNFIHITYYYYRGVLVKEVYNDAGLAYYLGEFGIIGFVLFLILLCQICLLFTKNQKNETFSSSWIIFGYILISLPAESILLGHGVELAAIIYIIYNLPHRKKNLPINEKFKKIVVIGRLCDGSTGPGTMIEAQLQGFRDINEEYTFINTYNLNLFNTITTIAPLLTLHSRIINVHTYGYKIPLLITIISKINHSNKYFLTVHGITTYEHLLNHGKPIAKTKALVEKVVLEKFPNIICVSGHLESFINNKYKRANGTISHIVCSLPSSKRPTLRRRDKNDCIVLYTGGFSLRKNPLDAIRIFEKIYKESTRKSTLIMCGPENDIDLMKQCKKYISRRGLKKVVSIDGMLGKQELEDRYREATYILAPSKFDTFNISVLEAMSHGCIPIISAECGIKSIIDNNTGLIFNDINDFKNKFQNHHKLSSKKAARVSMQATPRNTAQSYLKIYGNGQ